MFSSHGDGEHELGNVHGHILEPLKFRKPGQFGTNVIVTSKNLTGKIFAKVKDSVPFYLTIFNFHMPFERKVCMYI